MVIKNSAVTVNEVGATTGETGVDWFGIEPEVLDLEVRLLYEGGRRHQPSGWKTFSVEDHLNHALQHINRFRMKRPEDAYTPDQVEAAGFSTTGIERWEPEEYALLQELNHARARLGFAMAVLIQGGPLDGIPERKLPR